MKKVLSGFLLLTTVLLGSTLAFPRQDAEAIAAQQAVAQQAAEQQAAEMRRIELRRERDEKATDEWVQRLRQESESNLTRMAFPAAEARARQNDAKYAALQRSADDLLMLSQRIHEQVASSGAQSVSVRFFTDLDNLEKAVKELRKASK